MLSGLPATSIVAEALTVALISKLSVCSPRVASFVGSASSGAVTWTTHLPAALVPSVAKSSVGELAKSPVASLPHAGRFCVGSVGWTKSLLYPTPTLSVAESAAGVSFSVTTFTASSPGPATSTPGDVTGAITWPATGLSASSVTVRTT